MLGPPFPEIALTRVGRVFVAEMNRVVMVLMARPRSLQPASWRRKAFPILLEGQDRRAG
jgi:hypothetical protein